MKIVKRAGRCVSCDNTTNIKLDKDVYACVDCLNIIGKETNNVREWINNNDLIFDKEIFIKDIQDFLLVLKKNNINSIDNIIKTLDAITIYNKHQKGTIDKKSKKKIEKELDILLNL